MDKVTQKVWDTIHGKWMRWIHKICRKQMRWREKFFWWKICENELGGHLPHTLCIPQPQPFYNFFPCERFHRLTDPTHDSRNRNACSQFLPEFLHFHRFQLFLEQRVWIEIRAAHWNSMPGCQGASKPKSQKKRKSSWWFFTNPFEKYARQNGFIFHKYGWK